MTDAETNVKIAEAMGWKFVDHHPQGRIHAKKKGDLTAGSQSDTTTDNS